LRCSSYLGKAAFTGRLQINNPCSYTFVSAKGKTRPRAVRKRPRGARSGQEIFPHGLIKVQLPTGNWKV